MRTLLWRAVTLNAQGRLLNGARGQRSSRQHLEGWAAEKLATECAAVQGAGPVLSKMLFQRKCAVSVPVHGCSRRKNAQMSSSFEVSYELLCFSLACLKNVAYLVVVCKLVRMHCKNVALKEHKPQNTIALSALSKSCMYKSPLGSATSGVPFVCAISTGAFLFLYTEAVANHH